MLLLEKPTAITSLQVWGGLYPPHILADDVLDEEAFMKLAPFGDDIWFNAMAQLKGTTVKQVQMAANYYLLNPYNQDIGLCNANNAAGSKRNDEQIKQLFSAYHIDRIIGVKL